MRFDVRVRGGGTATVAAYGPGDAEQRIERELSERWPGVEVEIREIRRGEPPRIVEEFAVSYNLRGTETVTAEDEEAARRAAFRQARERLTASRFARTAWERAEVIPAG